MKTAIALMLGLLVSPLALAQYRCVESGKTVFSDRPCLAPAGGSSPSDKVVGDTGNSAYSTLAGTWRGQVQFMAKSGTAVVSEAHAVVPFVITLDAQGKVQGSASEIGCVFKGIALPGISPNITEIDVTFSSCSFAGYNRQMTGRLALYKEKRYVDFSVVAYDMNRRPGGYYEVKGPLRR